MSSLVALVLDSQSQQSADYLNKLRFRNENMANLEKRIEESKYTASKTKPLQTSFIKKEMDLFEASLSRGAPERPEHLELLYQSLLTLPPSSVTSERAFSAAGLFSTKIRSRLGDSTLNSLVFLRDFYKRQNKNV